MRTLLCVFATTIVLDQVKTAPDRSAIEACHQRSAVYFQQAMRFMRDQDLRAFFTEAAACGCAQICLAAEANQFQNTMAVLAVNRLLFERWKAANVDEKGETQAWREAIAYCRAQQEKGLVPRAIAEANCTIRLTVPHDDIDLRDALKQACVSGEDLARLKKLIMDCVGPVDALVGAFVLQRKFDAAASAAGCK